MAVKKKCCVCDPGWEMSDDVSVDGAGVQQQPPPLPPPPPPPAQEAVPPAASAEPRTAAKRPLQLALKQQAKRRRRNTNIAAQSLNQVPRQYRCRDGLYWTEA